MDKNGNGATDNILGDQGNDQIIGGAGSDILTGGAGRDIFIFEKLSESKFSSSDRITDFVKGQDKIDLSELYFTGIIKSASSPNYNILAYRFDGNNTIIEDHDHTFALMLNGKITLDNGDFDF